MISILEKINEFGSLLLLLCAYVFLWHFRKIKLERKLTKFEFAVYLMTYLGALLYAGSFLFIVLKIGI